WNDRRGSVETDANGEFEFAPERLEEGANDIWVVVEAYNPLGEIGQPIQKTTHIVITLVTNTAPTVTALHLKNEAGTTQGGTPFSSDITLIGTISDGDHGIVEGVVMEFSSSADFTELMGTT